MKQPDPLASVRQPNWVAMRNLANRRRFDEKLTIDRISDHSGLARSTVVMLLTGEDGGGRLATWYALAQGLGLTWTELAAALDDPDYDQPDLLHQDDKGVRPPVTSLIRQITAMMPAEKAAKLTAPDLHKLIVGMGYEDVTQDSVRVAKWRIDQAARD